MSIKKRYHDLQKVSQEHLGWQWLLPLPPADAHHLQSLNIPETDKQSDFDSLLLSLAKMLIDSLNEEALKKLIPYEKRDSLKDKSCIDLLEAVLHLNDLKGSEIHIVFLRKLQNHCSSRSTDPKGQGYLKVVKPLKFRGQNLQHISANILNSASDILEYFITLVRSGHIHEIIKQNHRAAADAILKEIIGMAESDQGFKKSQNRSPSECDRLLEWIDVCLNDVPQEFLELNDWRKKAQLKLQEVEQALQKVPTEEVLKPLVEKLSELNQTFGQLREQDQETEQSIHTLSYQLDVAERKLDRLRYAQ